MQNSRVLIFLALGGIILMSGRRVFAVEIGSDDFTKFDSLFKQYGSENGVNWKWLKAICMNESSLGMNSRVKAGDVSTDGKSWGIMQLTLPTAGDYHPGVTIEDLNNPDFSVRVAAQFLGDLNSQFSGDMRKVVMSYNQGAGNTRAGREYASGYYDRFVRNLSQVEEKQP